MVSREKKQTLFGTLIWGRNFTGQPHWLDGSVYPGIDGQSYLKNILYVPLDSHVFTHRLERLREEFSSKDANGRPEWFPIRYDIKKVPDRPLLVNAEMGRKYLARKWIGAYEYMGKDQDLWLTHNHLPPSEGGHPVIFMYGTGPAWFEIKSTKSSMHEAFATAKQEFKKHFGVEPFLIVDKCYVDLCPVVKTVADGEFLWVPAASKTANNDTARKTDFTNPKTGVRTIFGFVMPGFEWLNKELAHCARRRRWIALDGSEGDEKHLLTSEFGKVMEEPKPDFVMIGYWNDFQEGQNFGRGIYPAKSGSGILPHDYYLRAVRQLVDASRCL